MPNHTSDPHGAIAVACYVAGFAVYLTAPKLLKKFDEASAKRRHNKQLGEWTRTAQDIKNLPEAVQD